VDGAWYDDQAEDIISTFRIQNNLFLGWAESEIPPPLKF
jgi:hypothetical protein